MPADYVFVRPNGKLYRPKSEKLRARAWENPGTWGDESAGVVVLGTLNPDEARPFAQQAAESWYGDADSYQLTDPGSGWWRDGFQHGERTWIQDDDRGAPGVMFTWAERVTGSSS